MTSRQGPTTTMNRPLMSPSALVGVKRLLLLLGCFVLQSSVVQGAETQKWIRNTDDNGGSPPPALSFLLVDFTIRMKYGSQGLDSYQCTDTVAQMVHQGLQECVKQYSSYICQLQPVQVQLGSATCAGTDVNFTNTNGGGYLDFTGSTADPSIEQVNICVARIVESSTCLDWMQNQYFSSSSLASINYVSDIRFATPTTPAPSPVVEVPPALRPALSPSSPPIILTNSPTSEPTIDSVPTAQPTTVAPTSGPPTTIAPSDAPSGIPTSLPSSSSPTTANFTTSESTAPLVPVRYNSTNTTDNNSSSTFTNTTTSTDPSGVMSNNDATTTTTTSASNSGFQQQQSFPMVVGAIVAGTILIAMLVGLEVTRRRRKNNNNNDPSMGTNSDSSMEGGESRAAVSSPSNNNKSRSVANNSSSSPKRSSFWGAAMWRSSTSTATSQAVSDVFLSPAITIPLSDDDLIGEYHSEDDVELDRSMTDMDTSGGSQRRLGIAPLAETEVPPTDKENVHKDNDDVEQPPVEMDVQSIASSFYEEAKNGETGYGNDGGPGRGTTSLRLISMVDVDETQSVRGQIVDVEDERVFVTTGTAKVEQYIAAKPSTDPLRDIVPNTTPSFTATTEDDAVVPSPPESTTTSAVLNCTELPLTTCVNAIECAKPSMFYSPFFTSLYGGGGTVTSSKDEDNDIDESTFPQPAVVSRETSTDVVVAQKGEATTIAAAAAAATTTNTTTTDFDLDPSWNPDDNSVGQELDDMFVVSVAKNEVDSDQQCLLSSEGYRTTRESRSSQLRPPLERDGEPELAAAPSATVRGMWGRRRRPQQQQRAEVQNATLQGSGLMQREASSSTAASSFNIPPGIILDDPTQGEGESSCAATTYSI